MDLGGEWFEVCWVPLSQWLPLSGLWDDTRAQPGGPKVLEKGKSHFNFGGEAEQSRPAGEGHFLLLASSPGQQATPRIPSPGSLPGLPPASVPRRGLPAWPDRSLKLNE